MNPDISYIARIDKELKELAIQELKHFCINTDTCQFDPKLITDDCMITFMVDDEESTNWFKERYLSGSRIPGKTLIGNIQLWIRDQEEFCDFEFWAVSSDVGWACLGSQNLKDHLVVFVKKLHGQNLRFDDSSGWIETIFENNNRT